MFNLEESITEWRHKMLTAGIKSSELLDELESHLREDVAQQLRSGTTEQEAFEIAARRIGQPEALRNEFFIAGDYMKTCMQWLKEILLKLVGGRFPSPAFTASAQKTLELGGKEAIGFHHDFVGTEHVLLGLMQLEDSAVAGVLRKMGVDCGVVRSEIEKLVGCGPIMQLTTTPPYTPRVRKALELAGREAKLHHHSQVRPEHIFLGLLLEGSGVAALVLKNLGVDIQVARKLALTGLDGNQAAG